MPAPARARAHVRARGAPKRKPFSRRPPPRRPPPDSSTRSDLAARLLVAAPAVALALFLVIEGGG
ncbi:MAG TPA: hypothetical protein VL972_00800, partial [Solirubrobacteraceae bacterium]|nr:hypothetical protein [Solirubrobacteraceae bacterium]